MNKQDTPWYCIVVYKLSIVYKYRYLEFISVNNGASSNSRYIIEFSIIYINYTVSLANYNSLFSSIWINKSTIIDVDYTLIS
jgi:hypothetical protein